MRRSIIHSRPAARKAPLRWLCAYRWHIGIRKRSQPLYKGDDMRAFTILDAPTGHYYADPFIFESGGRTYLFFEDYDFFTRLGILKCAELDGSQRLDGARTILERPYHLSYPHVFQFDGSYYMIPETASANRVELYRAVNFPWEWKLQKVLLSGAKYQDTTLLDYGGRHWLLAGGSSTGLTGDYDQLHVFHAKTIFDTLTPHPCNPVKTHLGSARPAGAVIEDGGSLIRPAQDCGQWYGCGLTFMAIDAIDESVYRERPLTGRLESWKREGTLGAHTYNASEHFEVVDFCSYGIDVPAMIGRARSIVPLAATGPAAGPIQARRGAA